MRTTRLQVTLCEVSPAVVRVIDVPAACTLSELHDLLQVAVGWTDSHLHQFVAGDVRYGVPDPDFDTEQRDEVDVLLRDLPARFGYLYDFGDGWEHEVELLGAGEAEPGCRYGEGRCPPEDCGGPPGYANLVRVLADPTHDEHDHLRSWVGEWPEFDQVATDRVVRDMVGQVPASVTLLLDLIGDGVKLTPGGRLPRVLVRQVHEQRPEWYPLGRPAQVEDDLPPLAALHDLLRSVGVLRLAKGTLYRTKIAGDPSEVVRRLRSAYPRGRFTTLLAGDLVARLVVSGPMSSEDLTAAVFPRFEHGWSADGQPLTVPDLRRYCIEVSAQLKGLDQIAGDWRTWHAGPAAQSLLPRATALIQLWGSGRHKITTGS